jgi:hypothetical protein
MDQETLFLPFFCSNCNHLAFIVKQQGEEQPTILEYSDSCWSPHLCYNVKGSAIWSHQRELNRFSWGDRQIPVKFPGKTKTSKSGKLTLGIIVELAEPEENSQSPAFIKVTTIEGSLIQVRTVEQQSIPSAGLLIDLKKAKKVGNDKYRLPAIKSAKIDYSLKTDKTPKSDYFKLSLSSFDQEQLEVYIARFLIDLSSHNIFPTSIIPLPISTRDEQTRYSRKIAIPSSANLQKTIKNMTIPESIELSLF